MFAVGGGGAGDAEIVGGVVEEGGAEVGAMGGKKTQLMLCFREFGEQ